MTKERKIHIWKMTLSGGIHGITSSEIRELERQYQLRCESYSCGGCVMKFLKQLVRLVPLEKIIEE